MLRIDTFKGGYDDNFSYLVWTTDSREAVLIDASTSPEPVRRNILDQQLALKNLLITHTHQDHIIFLDSWLEYLPDIRIAGHRRSALNGNPRYIPLPDLGTVILGTSRITLIETPGHYPDSVCWHLAAERILFTGDTIFVNRTGRTIGAGGDTRRLYHSVYDKLLTLPGDTTILPGHDYGNVPTITIKELSEQSGFFRCSSEGEFKKVMDRYERGRHSGD